MEVDVNDDVDADCEVVVEEKETVGDDEYDGRRMPMLLWLLAPLPTPLAFIEWWLSVDLGAEITELADHECINSENSFMHCV